MERLRESWNSSSSGWVKQWIKLWTRSLMMMSSASSLPPAIRCWPSRAALRSRCAWPAASQQPRLPGLSWLPEKTLGQRIFRAKKTLSEAHVPFETPRGDELRKRLESVLSVVYLIFNEGYTATSGGEWMRASLCEDALRLGRVLAEILPEESEVHGLLALMELQASRAAARRGPTGEAVLLSEQDRSLWDHAQIERGMAALQRAQQLGGGAHSYALQAAIAACHVRAYTAAETDWERIVLLYDALLQISPSPIVALNRAVALGMAHGPAAGLHALDALAAEQALANYHLLPSVRGDLLMKLGRYAEAREELQRALAMTDNVREHELLSRKLKQAMFID